MGRPAARWLGASGPLELVPVTPGGPLSALPLDLGGPRPSAGDHFLDSSTCLLSKARGSTCWLSANTPEIPRRPGRSLLFQKTGAIGRPFSDSIRERFTLLHIAQMPQQTACG